MNVDLDVWDRNLNRLFTLAAVFAGLSVTKMVTDYVSTKRAKAKKKKSRRKRKKKKEKKKKSQETEQAFPKIDANISEDFDQQTRRSSLSPRRKVSFRVEGEKSEEQNLIKSKRKLRNRVIARKISFDAKLIQEEEDQPLKILITGGPCAGKTTGIAELANTLRNIGFNVIVVPEAASLIFSSGATLDLSTYTMTEIVEFQKNLMEVQIALENKFARLATIKKQKGEKKSAVIFDRGLLDGSAYVEAEQWDAIMDEVGINKHTMLKRYDIVIHMVTAADGAEKHYQTDNNQARSEGLKLAIELDRSLQRAYASHSNQIVIGNYEVNGFSDKIQSVQNYILQTLQVVPINNYHRKYLVRDPKGELFQYLLENHGVADFTLVDRYISFSEDGKKIGYLRRRIDKGGKSTYVLGERIYQKDGKRTSKKKSLIWRVYQALDQVYKKCDVIERRRLVVYLPNQKLIIDKFEIQKVKFLQIIIQIKKTKGHITNYTSVLPIIKDNVVYEISDDPNFRLEAMCKEDWKMYEKTKNGLLDYEKFKEAVKEEKKFHFMKPESEVPRKMSLEKVTQTIEENTPEMEE